MSVFAAGQAPAQTQSSVIARGQDFAVHERVTLVLGAAGQTRFRTNRVTLLKTGCITCTKWNGLQCLRHVDPIGSPAALTGDHDTACLPCGSGDKRHSQIR